MSIVRILGNLVRLKFAVDDFPTQFRHSVFGSINTLKESGVSERVAAVGNIAIVEIDVYGDGRGVCEKARIDFIVSAEPVEDLIIDWGKPGYSLSHFLGEFIAHRSHLRAGLKRNFAVIRIYQLRISAKQLSHSSVLTDVCHKLGVTSGLPGWKNRLDACPQQTPSVAKASMNYKATRRLNRVGTERGTDAVAAPAPHSLAGCTGASARMTANANHARTASTKPNDGGGQRAGF